MSNKKLAPSDYVHLHTHSQYSLLDGLSKIPDLIDITKDYGMEAVALTDHGTLSGAIEFYKAAKSGGVKPIIGIEAYMAARKLSDKEPVKDKPYYHLILLAMNKKGYQNLMALSTIANLEGFYYKPRIDKELLSQHNEGLICLSGCASSEIGEALRSGLYEEARQIASWYKQVFGDRYYIEIQDHGHPDHPTKWDVQENINQELIKISQELDIPGVVTCDSHYLRHKDQEAHEILLCIQTGSFLSTPNRMSLSDIELHYTDPKQVIGRWGKDYPDFISNTRKIADRCETEISLGNILIPKFDVPKGEDEKSYLEKLVMQGLAYRYGNVGLEQSAHLSIKDAQDHIPTNIMERTKYELSVIDGMGYNGYFLIVQDFINWGKDRGIIFGPGRGSAAGSVVSYAIRITEIDPFKYDLMFERFLNPGRISMPDIDIDIQDTRRDEVIQYCVEKYGKERVANIVTFGRMAARNAVRDVARVLQVPYAESDRLAKMIPPPVQGRHIPLKVSIKDDKDMAEEYKNPESKKIFDLAMQLEGTVRSHGVHAAGVVIAPEDIVFYTPLEMAQKGVIATQYPMGPVEELGLLKMDFLGLSNLTILNNTLRIVKRVYAKSIVLGEIPNDDEKTFELFRSGDTTGVFQFESAGMKRYLRELKPTEFDDLIAMNALYRPGPMQEIPRFIEGKNNPNKVHYLHQSLEPILKDTYGVMVYQEQIIKLLQLVAGYTPGEADLVRKAIGKKNRNIMEAEEPKFIEGCIKQGLSESQAKTLWSQIQPFADYSFNKAHATCYSQIAYWTAYLKAHYPAAFLASLMTSDFDDTDRLAIEINECLHHDIPVLQPDVNESFHEFAVTPDKKAIRFGMNAIKNVGAGAVEEIIQVRSGHPYVSIEDFFTRINSRVVNKKTVESLIKSGAFDRFEDRGVLLENLETLIAFSAKMQKQSLSGQVDLFGNSINQDIREVSKLKLVPPDKPLDYRQRLTWERELMGLYLSASPLDKFKTILEEKTIGINSLSSKLDGKSVTVGGIVQDARVINTKNGQKMAFVKIEDEFGEIEIILFPSIWQQTLGTFERDKVVMVKGKVNAKDKDGNKTEDFKIIVDEGREITLEQAEAYEATGKKIRLPKPAKAKASSVKSPDSIAKPAQSPARIYIRLSDTSNSQLLSSIKETIELFNGETPVVLVIGDTKNKQAIKLPSGIESSDNSLGQLRNIVGSENLIIQ